MIYTRYLYDKNCVEYSLFVSLLNHNKEEALFWGLELFYSGFKDELIALIWRYYYELYAPFYINLETHILKYTKLWMENRLDDVSIATILNNLCERDACVDFYIMYKNGIVCPNCLSDTFGDIDRSNNKDEIFKIAKNAVSKLKLFKTRGKNALNNINLIFETVSLPIKTYKSAMKSRLITGLFLLNKDYKYDPKFYIILKSCDIVKYKTKPLIQFKGWKIPPRECVYTLHLKPSTPEKNIGQYDDWLYYASKAPLWEKRIIRHKGTIDQVTKKITFESVENEEEFFNIYNYEPDEQTMQTQSKWFGVRTYDSWDHIYEKHKCEPYNDWIVEYNN